MIRRAAPLLAVVATVALAAYGFTAVPPHRGAAVARW